MMADCVGFQAQIAAIIEMLANSAVVEICKLVDDGYAALRSQMDREREKSETENDALRRRLRDMDVKMRTYERKMRRRSARADGPQVVQFRPPDELEDHMTCDAVPLVTDQMGAIEDSPQDLTQEEGAVVPLVKEESSEKTDCNLDLKVEVNIRSETGLSSVLQTAEDTSDAPPEPSAGGSAGQAGCVPGDTVDLTCRSKRKPPKPTGSGAEAAGESVLDGGETSDVVMKPEADASAVAESNQLMGAGVAEQPSPERLSLGMDLAWMQERVSHLGAAFAVAQLGLGNSDTGHQAASFAAQAGGGDCLDGPPTMVFPGAAVHDMAAFAASFDLAAAGTAPPPTTPPSTTSPNQTRPYVGGVAKEPLVCGVCGRVFPSSPALELHRRVHAGERPFSCPHCGKGFAQANNLRVHLLIHSGERRYRCSLCGKSFISSSHLKRHRTVHTQEKPYSCARCGQSFSQMCSVRRHRQQSQCGL
ncbi:unnamed protein product [Merluccius merluccius]